MVTKEDWDMKKIVATMTLPIIMMIDVNGLRLAQAQPVSTSVVGFIDKITRQDDGQLLITGWGLDIHGNGVPVWMVSIYNGEIIFTGTTSGGRADIKKAHPEAITDNV